MAALSGAHQAELSESQGPGDSAGHCDKAQSHQREVIPQKETDLLLLLETQEGGGPEKKAGLQ